MTWLAARSLFSPDELTRCRTALLTEMAGGGPVTVAQPALASARPALPGRAGATLRRQWPAAPQSLALLDLLSSSPLCALWPNWPRS